MEKIIFEKVGLSFSGREIFKNLGCELNAGRITGIVGRNGSGKSTFLKLAGKIIKPDTGEINFFDGKILSRAECAKKIAAITPEMKIYDELTAEENLKFFMKLRGKNFAPEIFFALGERVGLNFDSFGKIRVGNFSTGMRQRLKFAILLAVDSEIWLLDEPTSNLDDEGRKIFYAEIKNAAQNGKIILTATNEKSDMEICNEIIRLPLD